MGQNHHVIDCSWHQTRSRFENWLKIPRSTVIDLTVSAAVCNICLAHPPSTCLCNGYEETNTVPTQFYFIALFKMEQTQEYLSHGKFQYCNICFCQESDWKFSITVVCLLMGKKKKRSISFWKWKCCYKSLCGCYSFQNDSPISTMPLEELPSSWM